MAQVLTEGVNLAAVVEATLGAAVPPSSGWVNFQPNSLGDLGSSYKKLARSPISKNRMNQRPILVDEDSQVPWQSDVTKDFLDFFAEGIFMAATKHNGGTGLSRFVVTAVTGPATNAWTVAASGALATGVIVYVRGCSNAANNGLHVLTAGSTGTSIKTADALVTEVVSTTTPPTLDVVGLQCASGDVGLDASGNLTSTTTNWTSYGLQVGQWIWVGGGTAAAPGALGFANLAYRGFAKVKAITATLLTLERRSWTVGSADVGAAKTIQIFFSRWVRNVSIDSADYKQPSYAFEVTYPNLGAGPVPEYEYPLGNLIDQAVINIPLTSKATCDLTFVGTVTGDPTTTRVGGPSAATNAVTNVAVSTATDLMRLRMSNVDETGISTDFQSIKLTVKNNVAPEKQLGTLGAAKMNVGRFECMVDADVIFSSDQVIIGIHDNRASTMDVGLRNGDAFGALLDLTSASIDDGNRKFEANKSVVITSKVSGFQDATYNFVLGLTTFGYLPAS